MMMEEKKLKSQIIKFVIKLTIEGKKKKKTTNEKHYFLI
jgi:hypothetical protein